MKVKEVGEKKLDQRRKALYGFWLLNAVLVIAMIGHSGPNNLFVNGWIGGVSFLALGTWVITSVKLSFEVPK